MGEGVMDKPIHVFVYGTLRKHERNAFLLEGATCVAEQCYTWGELYDTGNGFPAMVLSDIEKTYGELYAVSVEQLQQLDWLEGYDENSAMNHYDRSTQTIFTDQGNVEAFVYTYTPGNAISLQKVPFGDWKYSQYKKQNKILYFAYGSCMDDERFYEANVNHFFENIKGCGIIQGYNMEYRHLSHDGGRADMVEGHGWVEGKVYEIEQDALQYLFRREGVNSNVYRPAFIDVVINGDLFCHVLTFLVVNKKPETAPPNHYAKEIIRGAKGFVSEEYFEKIKMDLVHKLGLSKEEIMA
jgi:gamma-glutamylcyclotransferase (GGCT)/AIG2-like uncharacterized protein YtfP